MLERSDCLVISRNRREASGGGERLASISLSARFFVVLQREAEEGLLQNDKSQEPLVPRQLLNKTPYAFTKILNKNPKFI
jgi:hypothetical protein